MKKIWKYAILLVALSALLCMSAFAADELTVTNISGTASVNANEESFTATYNAGEAAAGSQYLIIMLAGTETTTMPDPTDGNILYVNQDAAGEDGVVRFETVYPMALEDSVIWLTGGPAPVALAAIDAPDPVGVTVSGTAASWNSTDDAVYLLYNSTVEDSTIKAEWKAGTYNAAYTGTKGTVAANADGKRNDQSFSFAGVANGTYKLAIFKPGKYVPKIVTVTVSGSNVELGEQKLWLYGDVTYDGSVKANDAAQITRKANGLGSVLDTGDDQTKADRLLAADVTADGAIKANDAAQVTRKVNGLGSVFNNFK